MFEAQIAKGVPYLDKRYSPDWVKQIDLNRLNMLNGCHCIIGQLEENGHFNNVFMTPEEYEEAIELGLYVDHKDHVSLNPIHTKEWRVKIRQLRKERSQ